MEDKARTEVEPSEEQAYFMEPDDEKKEDGDCDAGFSFLAKQHGDPCLSSLYLTTDEINKRALYLYSNIDQCIYMSIAYAGMNQWRINTADL
jgi:hypothetical protein